MYLTSPENGALEGKEVSTEMAFMNKTWSRCRSALSNCLSRWVGQKSSGHMACVNHVLPSSRWNTIYHSIGVDGSGRDTQNHAMTSDKDRSDNKHRITVTVLTPLSFTQSATHKLDFPLNGFSCIDAHIAYMTKHFHSSVVIYNPELILQLFWLSHYIIGLSAKTGSIHM